MTEKFDQWVAEATEAAKAKKNSALPNNRRVQSNGNRYVRGTLVVIGSLDITLRGE